MKALLDYHYPGNVRELENILERAIALAENQVIRASDLQLGNRLDKTASHDGATAPLELQSQEKQAIIQALEQTRWNKTAAARLLGLTLRQLRYRMQKFGIE